MTKRRDFVLGGITTGVSSKLFAQAGNWPESAVKIIVPFTAGNASDVLTRMVAEKLQARFGQPFVVENRVGAGGMIGMEAWSRNQPKGANIRSAAIGSSPYLAAVLFRVRTGIPGVHIPFAGGAQSLTALIAGDTDFAIDNIASCLSLIRAGRVRALAVTSDYRWPTLPDVPTTAEAGIKDFVLTSWGALVLPKGTPPAIVNKLSAAVRETAADPALQQKFMNAGANVVSSTPAQTFAFAANERINWKEAVQVSGAKLD